MEPKAEMSPALMKSLARADSGILERGSWAVTCSVQFGDPGQIIAGRAGGENPPFHTGVVVLTHHEHPAIEMKGGTTFYFVTSGIDAALKKAVAEADGKDVRLGGVVSTVREFVKAGLVDEIHLAIIPTLLGAGEHLLSGIDLAKMGYRCVEYVPSAGVAHVVLRKQTA